LDSKEPELSSLTC